MNDQSLHEQTIKDIKKLWGEKEYEALYYGFKDKPKVSKQTFINAMKFCGLFGDAADSFYREIWPDADDA